LTINGYHGKILNIDLGNKSSWIHELDESTWRTYGGGGLLGTYLLLTSTLPGNDALDPANPLMLLSSVMAGHPYVGLPRCTVVSKSPLTGGVGETRCDGPFAVALKDSGVDGIVLRDMAAEPSIVLVDNGQVSFHDAEEIWGQPVSRTVDWLERRFGSQIHSAVIGPAGERRVRFASIVTDRSFQAPRMGLGAVMGSKQVKAIVIRGEHRPPLADPERCTEITERYRQRMLDNPLTRWQYEPPGFSAWVHTHGTDAALCTRNYRDSVFEGAGAFDPKAYMAHYRHDGICPGCPNNCIKFFGTRNDRAYDPRAGGIHQEITGALGPNLGIADVEFLFAANILCNEYGLDPTSLGFTISMAMESVEQGALRSTEAGCDLRFGNAEAALTMIRLIASRDAFGTTLAEGTKRAAEQIGGAAPDYAMHVKGLELAVFEPRTQTNLALGYATAPIGPRFDICEHDWDYDTEVGWPHALEGSRTLGILERISMASLAETKVRNFKALNTIWSACDALDLNVYAAAPTRALTLDDMAELLGAVTGWETSSYELMRFGERRNHLMRLYNLREGFTAADDTLPKRFFDEPIRQGKWIGTRLDQETFQRRISLYYEMMGWDSTGHPCYATLLDHKLEWAVTPASDATGMHGHSDHISAPYPQTEA
jgi:aldehyde:ferredoxin oxidoreductase